MPELSLVQLRHFCAVSELGSIAEAARQRHVSATAVGSAIASLEQVLGTKLCRRERSRGVTLTPNGHHFYREAQRIIRATDDLLRSLPEALDEYAGPLHVGAFTTVAPVVLPELLDRFAASHPDIRVDFSTGTVLDLVEKMMSGELHCFFSQDVFSRSKSLPKGLALVPLYRMELHVLLSAAHPLAQRSSLSIDDLLGVPTIVYESNPARRFSLAALGQLHPDMKVRYRTNDHELMRGLVGRGFGFTLDLSPAHAGRTFDGQEVVAIPLDPPLAGTSMVAVVPEGRWQHPSSGAIVALAQQLVSEGGLGASQ